MKSRISFLAALSLGAVLFYGWSCTVAKGGQQSETENAKTNFSISISTAHPAPLLKSLHASCAVNISYDNEGNARDILADPYYSFIKSLGFTSLQYSGGSTADLDHAIIGDTKISGGKGDGYNIREEDTKQRGQDINSLLEGLASHHFGIDFFNQFCALINKLQIPSDIIANVQSGTLDELYWKIDQAHAQRVIFGMEQNLPSNKYDFPDGNAYKQKISNWIKEVKKKYPNIITTIDAAPVYRQQQKFGPWNDAIKNIEANEVRVYLWDKDATEWSTDQNANLKQMNEMFQTTFPQWLQQVKTQFPGKTASICQWGNKPPNTPLFNTMAACIYIGKFYKFLIDYNKQNNNFITYASYMSLKSLNRGNGEISNHALALQLCGMLFSGKKNVMDLTLNNATGISGVVCNLENHPDNYILLLINESKNEATASDVKINGTVLKKTSYKITSVNAKTLAAKTVSMQTKNSASLVLPPYSVNIVEF